MNVRKTYVSQPWQATLSMCALFARASCTCSKRDENMFRRPWSMFSLDHMAWMLKRAAMRESFYIRFRR